MTIELKPCPFCGSEDIYETYSPEKNKPFMRGGWSTCEADGIVFLDIAEVIAWMSLPEPYEEEKE